MNKLLVVSGLVLAVFIAAISETSAQTIYSCYNKKSGAMRYVTGTGLCKKTETEISWLTAGGPKGDKGDKGDTGATGATGPQGPPGVAKGATAVATGVITYDATIPPYTTSSPDIFATPCFGYFFGNQLAVVFAINLLNHPLDPSGPTPRCVVSMRNQTLSSPVMYEPIMLESYDDDYCHQVLSISGHPWVNNNAFMVTLSGDQSWFLTTWKTASFSFICVQGTY